MNISLLFTPLIPALAALSALILVVAPISLPPQVRQEHSRLPPKVEAPAMPQRMQPLAGLQIPVDILRVIDGDTIEVRARIWPDLAMTTRLRLKGIDAPEHRGACDSETTLARQATERVTYLLATSQWLATDITRDKFGGRMVGRLVSSSGVDVGDRLLAEGLARPYSGRSQRQGWC
jgi:micrococcal nuclease